jgi:hypothetical protein
MKSAPPPPPPVYPSANPYDSQPIGRSYESRPVQQPQQYRSHAAPTFAPAPEPERPQYARFETASKPVVNEDALPAMPTWSEAKSTHVEEEVVPEKQGDMEMNRLDHNGSVAGTALSGTTAVAGARRSPVRSPVQRSPTGDTYGFPAGYQNEPLLSGAARNSPGPSPVGRPGQYGQRDDGYRGVSPVHAQSLSPVHGGGAGYTPTQQYGRHSPNQGYDQQYGQQYDQPAPSYHSQPPASDSYGYGAPPPARDVVEMPAPYPDYSGPAPPPSTSPQYPSSSSPRYEAPAASYPGQNTYGASGAGYPGQQTYHAFQPSQGEQYSGVTRKAVDGSWKEV